MEWIFHHREALTKLISSPAIITYHGFLPKYRYFGRSFAFFLYDMLVVTPCRTATGMDFIMEFFRWNIPSRGNEPSVERIRRITRRINAYLLQKLIDDIEWCSIEIICMFICFIGPFVSSHMLTLLVCI